MDARRLSSGRGRPFAPDVVAALQELVEGTTLPMRVIAARIGVSRATVVSLVARHGWTRPRPARLRLGGQRGGGHPIVPEVVAAARALVEGTALPYRTIAERMGVSATALCRWRKRGRWQRPDGASRADGPGRPARYRRGRGRPYAADAVRAVRALVTGTLLSQKAIARQVGISQGQVSAWMRKRGWTRPPVGPARSLRTGWADAASSRIAGPKRFAASQRRGPLATEGDRRGRPYAPACRAEARSLWEETRLPTALIAARVGAHPVTVARWAKEESWTPPHGRTGARQLRGFFGTAMRRASGCPS